MTQPGTEGTSDRFDLIAEQFRTPRGSQELAAGVILNRLKTVLAEDIAAAVAEIGEASSPAEQEDILLHMAATGYLTRMEDHEATATTLRNGNPVPEDLLIIASVSDWESVQAHLREEGIPTYESD